MTNRRYVGSSGTPDAWAAVAFLFLSVLGLDVFFRAGDVPVTVVFLGLTLIYLTEIPTRFFSWRTGGRLVGLFQLATGIWLMYCTYATATHLALGSGA
jgi:hypothetical protein